MSRTDVKNGSDNRTLWLRNETGQVIKLTPGETITLSPAVYDLFTFPENVDVNPKNSPSMDEPGVIVCNRTGSVMLVAWHGRGNVLRPGECRPLIPGLSTIIVEYQ